MPETAIDPIEDPVQELQFHLKAKEATEAALEASMLKLDALARNVVKEAFWRVFQDIEFPEHLRSISAIPSTRDNLRVDFEVVNDTRLKVRTLVDEPTWITFDGLEVDWPIAWVHLQVRIPLNRLSPTWIDKV